MYKEMSSIEIQDNIYEVTDIKSRGKIEELTNQIEGLASGTPLVANSIEEMVNTEKIYVNSSDGNWYYYTGSTWAIGGIYQGQGIENKSVNETSLSDSLFNSIKPNYEIVEDIFQNGYISSQNLTHYLKDNEQYKCLVKDVIPGETYYLEGRFYSDQDTYFCLDINNKVLKSYRPQAYIFSNITINIPKNAVKLYINVMNQHQCRPILLKVKNYSNSNEIKLRDLDEKLKTSLKEVYENITDTLEWKNDTYYTIDTTGSYNGKFKNITADNYKVCVLDVNPFDIYEISGYAQFNRIPSVAFLSKSIEKSQAESTDFPKMYDFKSYLPETIPSGSEFITQKIEIPFWCNKIIINNWRDTTIVKKVVGYDFNNYERNVLTNKIISFFGDSITKGTGNGYVSGWAKIIEENNKNTTCINNGIGGTTIAKREGRTDSVLEKIENADNESDYIIIQGGVNDAWNNVEIGEITTGYNDTYDELSFSGALEKCFRTAQLKWKGKKIGFIVTHKQPGADNHNFKNYMERAREICKKWAIPYIDLFNESCLNPYLDEINNEYFQIQEGQTTGDRCHPNEKGYKVITPKIENWIKSL